MDRCVFARDRVSPGYTVTNGVLASARPHKAAILVAQITGRETVIVTVIPNRARITTQDGREFPPDPIGGEAP
jgi:hypothetical protein